MTDFKARLARKLDSKAKFYASRLRQMKHYRMQNPDVPWDPEFDDAQVFRYGFSEASGMIEKLREWLKIMSAGPHCTQCKMSGKDIKTCTCIVSRAHWAMDELEDWVDG